MAGAATLSMVGCDKAREVYTANSTTPEQRMAGRDCGGAPESDRSVLGIGVGMPLSQAIAVLRCYDPKANFEQGVSGTAASDVNKFLRERSAGSSNYANLLVWTRGTTRPCTRMGEADTSAVSEALRPDDLKFAPWVFSAGSSGSGFNCYAKVQDQITLLADGAPGQQVVSGVWRVHVPADGKRPSLDGTFESLAARYPALDANAASRATQGFGIEGYLDSKGSKLNAAQIRSDFVHLTAPVAPTAPKTTESCGLLWMNTCERVPTAQERATFAAATEQFSQQIKAYQERRPVADAYRPCVKAAPSQPSERTVSVQESKSCGLAYFAAAKAYPGGFAEAFFVGIYSHPHSKSGHLQLSEYLKQFRDSGAGSGNKPSL